MSQPTNNGPKQEFNSQDIIANLRFADKFLVKVADFFLANSFLSAPMLWKVLLVLVALALPLQSIIALLGALAIIISGLLGNIVGLVAVAISLGYLLWLAKSTLFNPESDLKLSDLHGWSKAWVLIIFISMIVSALMNVMAVRNIGSLISVLIGDVISFTISMYLTPFFARYFTGVVLDGLAHHPESKFSPENIAASAENEEDTQD